VGSDDRQWLFCSSSWRIYNNYVPNVLTTSNEHLLLLEYVYVFSFNLLFVEYVSTNVSHVPVWYLFHVVVRLLVAFTQKQTSRTADILQMLDEE